MSTSLSEEAFLRELARFKASVQAASGGTPFESFRKGLPDAWEGYKPLLRNRALALMNAASWTPDRVGTGTILDRVVRAIEINESKKMRNNLVRWENRFGHANRSHRALLDAVESHGKRKRIEHLLFSLYRHETGEPELFEQLRGLTGDRYDLLAYLFFVRDPERFMPIAPVTCDAAFERLGIDLSTVRKCSWQNYEAYNDALGDVREALQTLGGIVDARLIDAHSFCWMLVKLPEDAAEHAAVSPRGAARKKLPGRVLDAREKWILMMVNSVEKTVRSSQGPVVEKAPKPKERRMTTLQLEGYIKKLLEKQEDKCALTGIPLQFIEKDGDAQLSPSLDRIDSDGHYESGNLQVVCRFINFWKSSEDDAEFRRLLSLVRGDED